MTSTREYCNICFKEFRNKVSLRTHRNMVHKVTDKIDRELSVVNLVRSSRWESSTPAPIVARYCTRPSMWRSTRPRTRARSSKLWCVNIAAKLWNIPRYCSYLLDHTMPGGASTSRFGYKNGTISGGLYSHSRVPNCWSRKRSKANFRTFANIWGEICNNLKCIFLALNEL